MQSLRSTALLLLLVGRLLEANPTAPPTVSPTELVEESTATQTPNGVTTDRVDEIDPTTTTRPLMPSRTPKIKKSDISSPLALLVRLSAANHIEQLAKTTAISPEVTSTAKPPTVEPEALTGSFSATGTFRLNV